MPIAILAAATLLAPALPVGAGQDADARPSRPMSPADTLALFRRLCVDTDGEAARFAAALAREPGGFRRVRILPVDGAGPNGSYLSDRSEVTFVDAKDITATLPAALPSRSCEVLTTTMAAVDHSAVAAAMAAALSLPAGTTREARPRGDRAALTEWTVSRAAGRTGYTLITRTTPDNRTGLTLAVRTFRSDQ